MLIPQDSIVFHALIHVIGQVKRYNKHRLNRTLCPKLGQRDQKPSFYGSDTCLARRYMVEHRLALQPRSYQRIVSESGTKNTIAKNSSDLIANVRSSREAFKMRCLRVQKTTIVPSLAQFDISPFTHRIADHRSRI